MDDKGKQEKLQIADVKSKQFVKGYDFNTKRFTRNELLDIKSFNHWGGVVTINGSIVMSEFQSVFVDGHLKHAFQLKMGDLLHGEDGNKIMVRSVQKNKRRTTFYKTKVAGNHTYFLNGVLVHNASRYWVGDGGDWDNADTTHWAATSGGAGGASVPTSADDVFFDANSFTMAAQVVNVGNSPVECDDLSFTGVTNTPDFSNNWEVNIYGSLTFVAGMTTSGGSSYNFLSTATGKTITSAGINVEGGFDFNGVGGGWTLQDHLQLGDGASSIYSISLNAGTLNLNNKNVSGVDRFQCVGTTARTITMGSGTFEFGFSDMSSGSIGQWTVSGSNYTINEDTSTILSSTRFGLLFEGGGNTYYNLTVNGIKGETSTWENYACILRDANTFNNLTIAYGSSPTGSQSAAAFFPGGITTTITGTLSITGNNASQYRMMVKSGRNTPAGITGAHINDATGTAATISAAAVSLTNVDFMDITGSGAASWTGTSLGNALGNSGITFTTPVTRYWVGNAGNWGSTTEWSTTSGGASGASVPLPQDTAVFNASSFSANGQRITFQSNPRCPTIDFTNIDVNVEFYVETAALFTGDLILKSGMTVYTANNQLYFMNRSTKSFDTASIDLQDQTEFIVDSPSGGITLTGTLTADGNNRNSKLVRGTFNANGNNVNLHAFQLPSGGFYGDPTRTLNLGTGTWTLSGYAFDVGSFDTGLVTNTTITASTSSIVMTGDSAAFVGGGKTYYNLSFTAAISAGSYSSIYGANTFNNLTLNPSSGAAEYRLEQSTTQTVSGTLSIQGTVTERIFIRTFTSGTQSKINAAAIDLDYVDFQDIDADGAAIDWTGVSLGDCGNNLNITFTTPVTRYWVGNGGNWHDTAHWSTSSGGATGASVPLPQDSAIFDANSFSIADEVILLDNNAKVGDLSFAAIDSTPILDFNTSYKLLVYGDLVLDSTLRMYKDGEEEIVFDGRSNQTLTTDGMTVPVNMRVNVCGAKLTLLDALTMVGTDRAAAAYPAFLYHQGGELDLNDFNNSIEHFSGVNDNGNYSLRTLRMGTGTLTITGDDNWSTPFEIDNGQSDYPGSDDLYVIVPETSTLRFESTSGGTITFYVHGGTTPLSFNNVTFAGVGAGYFYNYWGDYTGCTGATRNAGARIVGTFSVEDAPQIVLFDDQWGGESLTPSAPTDKPVFRIGHIDIVGTIGNLIILDATYTNESTPANNVWVWRLDELTENAVVQYAEVWNGYNITLDGGSVYAENSTDGGGNTFWIFDPPKYLTEVVTIVDTAVKTPGKVLAEAVTIVETFTKSAIGKVFAEVVIIVDSITKTKVAVLTLANEVITIVDTARAYISAKVLAEIVTIVDTMNRSVGRLIAETVTIVDTVEKLSGRILDEVVTIVDSINVSKAAQQALNEVVTIVDTFSRGAVKALTDVVTVVDTVSRSTGRLFSETVTIVDTVAKTIGKVFSEVVTVVDTFAKAMQKVLAETVTVVDTVTRAFLLSFSETVEIVETLVRTISRSFSESVVITDLISFFKRARGFILGRNNNTNTGIGTRGSPPVGKNNDTNTKVGTRL